MNVKATEIVQRKSTGLLTYELQIDVLRQKQPFGQIVLDRICEQAHSMQNVHCSLVVSIIE